VFGFRIDARHGVEGELGDTLKMVVALRMPSIGRRMSASMTTDSCTGAETFEIVTLGEIMGSRVATYTLHCEPLVDRVRNTTPLLGKRVATPL